jgi:hypothetical protein
MIIPSSTHGVIASSRPRVVVAGGFVEGDLPFNDITTGDSFGNTITATKSGTIHLSSSGGWGGSGYIEFYKNNIAVAYYDIEAGGSAFTSQPVTISINDELKFYCETNPVPESTSGAIYIRKDTISGSLIETITVDIPSPCLLTTAVVHHMSLLDNGPELTAMRQLLEYYIGVPGYADLIQEYYQTSPAIITAINALADPSVEYTYIYNTVVAVMNHVNGGEWQQAHDLYMAMYTDLKTRYLG